VQTNFLDHGRGGRIHGQRKRGDLGRKGDLNQKTLPSDPMGANAWEDHRGLRMLGEVEKARSLLGGDRYKV